MGQILPVLPHKRECHRENGADGAGFSDLRIRQNRADPRHITVIAVKSDRIGINFHPRDDLSVLKGADSFHNVFMNPSGKILLIAFLCPLSRQIPAFPTPPFTSVQLRNLRLLSFVLPHAESMTGIQRKRENRAIIFHQKISS